MKYKAIIETDEFEDFEFYEDGNGKYIHGIDAGSANGEWIALYFTECEQEPVIDKLRAELHATAEMHRDGNYYLRDEWIDEYFDKYKAESEAKVKGD